VDQSRARRAAHLREPMREQGIHLDAGDALFSRGPLLYDADRIDDRDGAGASYHVHDVLQPADVHSKVCVLRLDEAQSPICCCILSEGDTDFMASVPGTHQLVPEHAVAAEDEDPHAAFLFWLA
jgi:hypothetical protein